MFSQLNKHRGWTNGGGGESGGSGNVFHMGPPKERVECIIISHIEGKYVGHSVDKANRTLNNSNNDWNFNNMKKKEDKTSSSY